MSATRVFKHPSLTLPVIQTILACAENDQIPKEFICSTLKPVLPEYLMIKVRGILMATPYAPPTTEDRAKRLKVQASSAQKFSDPTLERLWRILNACSPVKSGRSEADENTLVKRAQMRALSNVFFVVQEKLVAGSPIFKQISSYLNFQELCRLSACTTEMHYELSFPSPYIWRPTAETFGLEKFFWSEYSRETMRKNFELLHRVNRAFGWVRKKELKKTEQESSLPLRVYQNLHTHCVAMSQAKILDAFKTYVKPFVASLVEQGKADFQDPDFYFQKVLNALTPTDNIIPILEMYIASGVMGGPRTLDCFCQAIFKYLQATNVEFSESLFFHVKQLILHRPPPASFDQLLCGFIKCTPTQFSELVMYCIRNGAKATEESLDLFLGRGGAYPLNLLPQIINAGAKIQPHHLSVLLYTVCSREEGDGQTILDAIDLILKSLQGERLPKASAKLPNHYRGPVPCDPPVDLLYEVACFEHTDLIKRVVSLGYEPDNSDSDDNTLRHALINRFSYNTIKTLYEVAGAEIHPNTAKLLINEYARSTAEKSALLKLFGLT